MQLRGGSADANEWTLAIGIIYQQVEAICLKLGIVQ